MTGRSKEELALETGRCFFARLAATYLKSASLVAAGPEFCERIVGRINQWVNRRGS